MLMEADLPDDLAVAHAIIAEQAEKLQSADAEVARLRAIIEAFQRHRFGRRSEQLDPDQLQLGLEDIEIALAVTARQPARRVQAGPVATARARPTVVRCPRILSGSSRSSISRTRLAPAAVARSTRSVRMSLNGSMWCQPRSGCWSRAGHATAAAPARAPLSKRRHRRALSKVVSRPRR